MERTIISFIHVSVDANGLGDETIMPEIDSAVGDECDLS